MNHSINNYVVQVIILICMHLFVCLCSKLTTPIGQHHKMKCKYTSLIHMIKCNTQQDAEKTVVTHTHTQV